MKLCCKGVEYDGKIYERWSWRRGSWVHYFIYRTHYGIKQHVLIKIVGYEDPTIFY